MQEDPGSGNDYERYLSVQRRAYSLWEQRGQPWGTPEIDWFRAEQELRKDSGNPEPVTITAAKVVGSVLGSVAGFVTSITNSVAPE
jgi:hypothetical protein